MSIKPKINGEGSLPVFGHSLTIGEPRIRVLSEENLLLLEALPGPLELLEEITLVVDAAAGVQVRGGVGGGRVWVGSLGEGQGVPARGPGRRGGGRGGGGGLPAASVLRRGGRREEGLLPARGLPLGGLALGRGGVLGDGRELELAVGGGDEDVALVLEEPVDGGVHELVLGDAGAGEVEGGEGGAGHERGAAEVARGEGHPAGGGPRGALVQGRQEGAGHHVRRGFGARERHRRVRERLRFDRRHEHVLRPGGLQRGAFQPEIDN